MRGRPETRGDELVLGNGALRLRGVGKWSVLLAEDPTMAGMMLLADPARRFRLWVSVERREREDASPRCGETRIDVRPLKGALAAIEELRALVAVLVPFLGSVTQKSVRVSQAPEDVPVEEGTRAVATVAMDAGSAEESYRVCRGIRGERATLLVLRHDDVDQAEAGEVWTALVEGLQLGSTAGDAQGARRSPGREEI